MTTRVAGLVALGLALFGGLAWFWMTSNDPGTRLRSLTPAAPGTVARIEPGEASVVAPPSADGTPEGRTGVSTRQAARPRSTGGHVTMIVRDESGGPIREALARWDMGQHALTCIGTRQPLALLHHGDVSAAKSPHRFATILPALVDGDLAFKVLVAERPGYLSLTLGGVVVATRKVELGESEVVVKLTELAARKAFGGVRFCIADGEGNAMRARAYLRGVVGAELTAEPDREGCIEFLGVPPGEYTLSVFANRYASHFSTVKVEPSVALQLPEVELQPPIPVVGRVTGDKRFRANRQLAIQALDRKGSELKAVELRQVSTDSTGSFRIFDLPAGEYAIRVVLPKNLSKSNSSVWPLSWPVLVDTRDGPQMDVALALEDAHGVVVRNSLPNDIELDVRDRAGVSVMRLSMGGKGVQHVPLLSGYYQLVATSGGREVARSVLRTPPAMTAIIGG